MKITRIRATHVNIPLEAPCDWSFGTPSGTTKAIVGDFDGRMAGVELLPADQRDAVRSRNAERIFKL